MKSRNLLLPLLITAVSCTAPKTDYLKWMYESMPLPDSLGYSREYWQANIDKTLEVREAMHWGIPELEFRHFVLPLRVNNETLDNFRTDYADTLCRRVKGLGIKNAALEINHWCHEQATYKPSDARTSSPEETIRRGVGRCGEESVLAVAALRAAGIPARQVYTPRWAHTDDNHAWVEVWADGKWWFMGACEPEPRLNMAWFNAPVSRAILLHTKVFGDYNGPEDVISRNGCLTEINVISGYVPARGNTITVTDSNGKPVDGAEVEYKIYNYAEFFTVAKYLSDAEGHSTLNTGKGDLLVWSHKDGKFGFAVAGKEKTEVVLEHSIGDCFSADIDITPPAENPIVTDASAEDVADNECRLAREDSIRAGHEHRNVGLERFRVRNAEGTNELIACLSRKDLGDVSFEVLEDALAVAGDVKDPYVLNPRVGIEALRAHRREILESGIAGRLHCPEEVAEWVRDSIRIVEGRNPQNLRIPPQSVWRSRVCDRNSRGIFFVALCRTLGFPARIDEVTGKIQYREKGRWMDVGFEETEPAAEARKGVVKFVCDRDPLYYRHFTIARLEDGHARLLEFGQDSDDTPLSSLDGTLEVGNYVLTSGTRLSNGGVLARLEFFTVKEGCTTEVPVVFRNSDTMLSVIGNMDPEELFLRDGLDEPQSLISATGRGIFLIAVTGDKDEPTSHAIHELQSVCPELEKWGRPVIILGKGHPEQVPEGTVFGTDPNGKVRSMLASGARTLPVIAICDSFGNIHFRSEGYDTSLSNSLRDAIAKLSQP